MLPIFASTDKTFTQMQTQWAQQINPVLNQPPNAGLLLKNVALINGVTSVNHTLGRSLTGWFVVRIRAAATIYDAQDTNATTDKTLLLISNAGVTVDLWVF